MAVRVVFEGPEGPVEAWAEVGDRLMDLADDHVAPVPFSCRSASCGICRMQVVEGGEHLTPVGEDEREVLDGLAAAPDQRLTCQAEVGGAGGVIHLRPVGGGPGGRR